jgi:diketogulonate reductase-like aldo/keto reductase
MAAIHSTTNLVIIPSEVEESLPVCIIHDVAIARAVTRDDINEVTRREVAKLISGTAAAVVFPVSVRAKSESSAMLARIIPSSGEELPVIGLGTWKAFDADVSADGQSQLKDVLTLFSKFGGRLIDSSPMYGRAEDVIGRLTSALEIRGRLFLATKVWTHGKQSGIQSMERSAALLRTNRIDLMQVHNLVDVNTQLATLREWKQQGRIRYTGITHYEAGALSEIERLMRNQQLDFVQINYSLMEPDAERRILPLAQERGVAVIANRPLGSGDLFSKMRSKPLPDWATEFDCRSWAQFFLKWIVANPAITCAIPATDKPRHLEDNMQSGIGRLPDAKLRRRMMELVKS